MRKRHETRLNPKPAPGSGWRRAAGHAAWLLVRPAVLITALSLVAPVSCAHAAMPSLSVQADSTLRFGAFVAFAGGSRSVNASGAAEEDSVWPLHGVATQPAQYTITYNRGSNDSAPITVAVQLVLGPVETVSQGAITGRLTDFTSDIPGAPAIQPGQIFEATIANCVSASCSLTFHLGASLQISNPEGGGVLRIPIPLTARLVAVSY